MKKKRLLFYVLLWLAAFWLSPQIFPGLFQRGYDGISGATARGGSGGYQLGSIDWLSDYKEALAQAEAKRKPLLIYFKAHDKEWFTNEMTILKNIPDIINEVTYLVVVLNRDENGEYIDEMTLVRETLKGQDKDKEVSMAELKLFKEEIALALKYKVDKLPQLVWCDHFGNKLQYGDSAVLSADTPGALRRDGRSAKETQEQLQQKLNEQYEPLRKKFETQKTEGVFSPALIQKLRNISVYNGYEPCKKAREYLAEINSAGEEKFQRLNQINPAAIDQEDRILIINLMLEKLNDLVVNYPALPVAEKALVKIEELREKLNPAQTKKSPTSPPEPGLPSEKKEAEKDEILVLLNQLNDNDFPTREKATVQLIKIGAPALPLLKPLVENPPNAEVKNRADRIVTEIEWGKGLEAVLNEQKELTKKYPALAVEEPRSAILKELFPDFRWFRFDFKTNESYWYVGIKKGGSGFCYSGVTLNDLTPIKTMLESTPVTVAAAQELTRILRAMESLQIIKPQGLRLRIRRTNEKYLVSYSIPEVTQPGRVSITPSLIFETDKDQRIIRVDWEKEDK